MRTLMLATALLAFAGVTACDRRDDPDVDPASTAVGTPPGEVVDPATPAPATTDPATPPGTLPPATSGTTDPACVGREGTEGCPEVQDQRLPTDPEPAQTPPPPR